MCGICGTAGFVDKALVARMNDVVAHRGPDDQGILRLASAPVALGNRRLSILDLSAAGHMPMANRDGSVVVTYNGEIYNAPELTARPEGTRAQVPVEVRHRGIDPRPRGVGRQAAE